MGKNTALYELLGVEPTATEDEIRKGYRKMALKYHPDKNRGNPDAEKMFVRVKEAYDVLSDPRKRSMYDNMGEDFVKVVDDPSTITPEVVISIVRSAPASERGRLLLIIFFVVFMFFWFVITLSLHIDGSNHWPWWSIMIPAYIVEAVIMFMDFASIPGLVAKQKYNKSLDKENRVPIYPDIIEMINSLLLIISSVTYALRLDGIIRCSYVMSLLPFFIYSLKNLYMPIIYHKLRLIDFKTMIDDMCSIIYYLTVLLLCMKVDGTLKWNWGSTFIFIWIYFAYNFLKTVFVLYFARANAGPEELQQMRIMARSELCMLVVQVFIAVAVLNKISGVWKWKISYIVIPIMVIIGLFACCFMCSIYAVLFGTQEDVPMQSDQYNYPSTNNNVPESVAVDINLNVD